MDLNVSKTLNKRQLNLNSFSDSKIFKEKIYTCYGWDNIINRVYLKQKKNTINGLLSDNTLVFSKDGNYMLTANLEEILFWNLNELPYSIKKPIIIKTKDNKMCIATLNNDSSKIYSGNNETDIDYLNIYDTNTNRMIQKIKYSGLNDISISPCRDNYTIVSNENGILSSFDTRTSSFYEIYCANYKISSIQCHPLQENFLLVTSNGKNSVYSIDLRNCKNVFYYNFLYEGNSKNACATYNSKGDQILVTRNRFCPLLFNLNESFPVFEFDEYGYHSFLKQKKVCFAGLNDEYVVSGSDNYNLYMWKIPDKNYCYEDKKITKKVSSTNIVLNGPESIANVVSYNYKKSILASYGANDEIYFWSPFSLLFEKQNKKIKISKEESSQKYYSFDFPQNFFIGNNSRKPDYLMFMDLDWFGNCNFKFLNSYNKLNINLAKTYNEDPNINLVKSFIYNFVTGEKLKNQNLLNMFSEALVQNTKGNFVLYLSLFFEINKIFINKAFINNILKFLRKYLSVLKDLKEKIKKKKLKLSKKEIELKLLKKVKLNTQLILFDIILIVKQNEILYKTLNELGNIPIIKKVFFMSNFYYHQTHLILKNEINYEKLDSECFKTEKFCFLHSLTGKNSSSFYTTKYIEKFENSSILKKNFKEELRNLALKE